MPQNIIYFDIAAVFNMVVATGSVLGSRVKRGNAYRTYLLMVVTVTLTAAMAVCGGIYDSFIGPYLVSISLADPMEPHFLRDIFNYGYYLSRTLNAPFYLLFIAAISDTSHRLTSSLKTKHFFTVPLFIVLGAVLTNPWHHGIFNYVGSTSVRGSFVWLIYASAVYYAVWGILHLLRWRAILDPDKFRALIALYPLVLSAVIIQLFFPFVRIEMFFTSISALLLAAFVIRPEDEVDRLTNTLSLNSYEEMCQRAFITEKPLCLVFIDIANKDRLRELAGSGTFNEIIRAVAMQMSRYLQKGDIIYYLRNGLFCISAKDTNALQALGIAQRSSVEGHAEADKLPDQSMVVQMRTCIVRAPDDVRDNATLQTFRHRIARLMPEPCVTTYAELSQHERFQLVMDLADVVNRGIKQRSFEVHYQPIWCVADRRFHSAEALLRLNDPEFGYVSPSLFIPEAEQNGSIVDVGRIMFEKTCAFLGKTDFIKTGLQYVEINLSVDQAMRPQLANELLHLINTNGIEPHHINLEITETSSSYSQQAIEANVHMLSSQGVTFSLDDFGTGYSNLTRALKLPFDLVKLDKSLVDGMSDENIRTALADTIAMLKELNKKVLVEGVETEEQAETLIEMGVDYIQGFLYAKPMPEDEFTEFLRKQNAT